MYARLVSFCVAVALAAAGAAAPPAAKRRPRSSRVTPVVEAYRQASPAVVNISTITPVKMSWRMFGGGDDPFEEFMPKLYRRTVPVTSLGSGFLIHEDGYIVTNAHVVRRAQKITVTLSDKATFEADVIAATAGHDLAVLKVRDPGKRKFEFLRLGRSDDLLIGETVITIGNPMGYQNTCTTGVLSGLRRKLEYHGGLAYDKLLQVDAPINPGNSGGPLLNINGELIGINTAIRADAQGIGFAIPVDLLSQDLPKLLDFERLKRLVIGLSVAQRHAGDVDELVVTAVAAGSPAKAAGCEVGDTLVEMDGRKLNQLPEYQVAMLRAIPTQTVKLKCRRGGEAMQFDIKVKARPRPDGVALTKKYFGLEFKAITPAFARQMRLPVEAGMLITNVESGTAAEELGIRRGDILFQFGRWYVTDLNRLGAILEDVKPGDDLRIGIIRGHARAWATIKARKPPARKIRI